MNTTTDKNVFSDLYKKQGMKFMIDNELREINTLTKEELLRVLIQRTYVRMKEMFDLHAYIAERDEQLADALGERDIYKKAYEENISFEEAQAILITQQEEEDNEENNDD